LAGEKLTIKSEAVDPGEELGRLEKDTRAYTAELRAAGATGERKKLESELVELTDRETLGAYLATITEEVKRLKDLEFIKDCLGDLATNAITNLGNQIADDVITPKLRDRFQEEIVKLAAEKVRVEIVRTGGRHGSPQYQIRFFAKPDAKIREILSEGEQTCVALAAFMTELATASHASTLVFDDPVSSLDHRWRKKVAERLVEEASSRQVILFTHDLIFVNDLADLAEEKSVPVQLRTLNRGGAGTGTVSPGLPWEGSRVEDRVDKLEKDARAAKALYDANEQQGYNKAAIDVYTGLRATWERALEDVGFFRVIQRHRDYVDIKHLKKVSALSEQDCDEFQAGYAKCCGIVDAHDPSRGRNSDAPNPTELLKDLEAAKSWVAGLRAKQKLIT